MDEEIEFEVEEITETFETFSIDEDIEIRFNAIQDFLTQAKVQYQAHVNTRQEYLKWLDLD